tara:strand:+ start:840 stop:1244 length:405 start_codon:yes stop_codon:yes gene_type:complete
MTPLQEIFDRAVNHALQMGEPSVDKTGCLYRYGENRCMVGAFISDEDYDEKTEGKSLATAHSVQYAVARTLKQDVLSAEQMNFFTDLQCAHDDVAEDFRDEHQMHETPWYDIIRPRLQKVAGKYHLTLNDENLF